MCKTTVTNIFENVNYALAGPKKMDELIALMTHSLRACPEHDRVFIDASNAFNLVDRGKAQAAMVAECPQLASVFHALYDGATTVWMRAEEDEWSSLLAEQGCVQGCVMGPLVFGFATLEAYRAVVATLTDCPNGWFGAYSDDGCISATHPFAITALETYLEEGGRSGLNVNFAKGKTEVLLGVCESDEEVALRMRNYGELGVPLDNIRKHPLNGGDVESYGYVHLGVPQGSSEYQLATLQGLVDEFTDLSTTLQHLNNPQEEWVFAYWVLRQKFPFWLRHMSPTLTAEVLPRIDGVLRTVLTQVVGQELHDDVWEQMCLPMKSHGFGLGRVADTATAAFVSNVQETRAQVLSLLPTAVPYLGNIDDEVFAHEAGLSPQCAEFVRVFRSHRQRILDAATDTGFDLTAVMEPALTGRKLQFLYAKVLSGYNTAAFERRIAADGTPTEKARVLSANGSLSGAWLLSVPKAKPNTIPPQAFRLSAQLRLGLPLRHLPHFCMCAVMDSHGVHMFACNQFSALLKNRHDAIQNDIKVLAQSGGIRADDRRLTVFRAIDEDDGKRPDLLLPGLGENGKDLLLDITIGTPTCSAYVARASNTPHYTLRRLHDAKNAKYLQRCTEIGASFMPMAFETYGAASEEVMGVMAKLVKLAHQATSIPYSVLFSYWKKRISTTLQVQNARIVTRAATKILSRTDRNDEAFDCDALNEYVHQDAQ